MEQEQANKVEEYSALIDKVLSDESIPSIYFNGFVVTLGTGDVLLILRRHNNAVAKLHVSYTVAKTLAAKVGGLIASLESASNNTIMTTDDIKTALTKSKDHGNEDAIE